MNGNGTQAGIGPMGGVATAHPYRRMRRKADPWHFCVNCSSWPEDHYKGSNLPPANGAFCRECITRHVTGSCTEDCSDRRMSAGARMAG
ncbi:MAG: hypothetical protein HZA24_11495 [Nitrospirae bacterium]|nr:hypothetical protein [Nitrospirota bacterium]